MPENNGYIHNQNLKTKKSFDDPNSCIEKSKVIAQNGILSILGQNIGLLSRKHTREKYQHDGKTITKKEPSSKLKFSNILGFPKNSASKKPKESPSKPFISKAIDEGQTKKVVNKNQQNIFNKSTGKLADESKHFTKSKNIRQGANTGAKSAKPAVQKKVKQSRLRKSHSDGELNISRKTNDRVSRAPSTCSRASSAATSRCSSRTTLTSCTSSKQNTPKVPKKTKRKSLVKQKKVESQCSVQSEKDSPPLFINYRYQVKSTITLVNFKCQTLEGFNPNNFRIVDW